MTKPNPKSTKARYPEELAVHLRGEPAHAVRGVIDAYGGQAVGLLTQHVIVARCIHHGMPAVVAELVAAARAVAGIKPERKPAELAAPEAKRDGEVTP